MFNILTRIVKFCKVNEKDIVFAATIILVAVISFGLGKLSKIREGRIPLAIENPEVIAGDSDAVIDLKQNITAVSAVQKSFVASKNGKKYYYVWCDSASRIKEGNRIWFSTKEEAQAAGYEPAANCKGL